MDYSRPGQPTSISNVPEDYRAIGARYADPRGRTNAMAGLGPSVPAPVEVLYPGTAKLRGGLLASLITSPELDADYVQRFQNIAIIAQLADTILAVARATGKCIVPLDFDPNEYTSPDDCPCDRCIRKRKLAASKNEETSENRKGKGKETEANASERLNAEETVSDASAPMEAEAVRVVGDPSASADADTVGDAVDASASEAQAVASGPPLGGTAEVLATGYPPPVDTVALTSKKDTLESSQDDQDDSRQLEEGDIWNVE